MPVTLLTFKTRDFQEENNSIYECYTYHIQNSLKMFVLGVTRLQYYPFFFSVCPDFGNDTTLIKLFFIIS